MSKRVEALGRKLMASYETVGFTNEDKAMAAVEAKPDDDEKLAESIPKQVLQFYMQIPTQYRLVYLLQFLYAHQKEKIIVFASNCELVNLLEAVCKKYDWNNCGRRVDTPDSDEKKRKLLFDGRIYKLHGDLEHEYRKINYFAFDKLLGGKSSDGS